MYEGIQLLPPIFEVGLKGYVYGQEAVELAVAADKISGQFGVQIVFDPQHVDIPACSRETQNLLVFAQHMDSVPAGRGCGYVLAESLKAAGAQGTLLNHAEHRMTLRDINISIQRADEAGLATLVCADSPEEAAAIAQLAPNMILAEPPDLIGTGESVGQKNKDFIRLSQEKVKSINSDIIVFNSAGIRTPQDVYDIILLGAEATGATSGIVKAEKPAEQLQLMVEAMKEAWTDRH